MLKYADFFFARCVFFFNKQTKTHFFCDMTPCWLYILVITNVSEEFAVSICRTVDMTKFRRRLESSQFV